MAPPGRPRVAAAPVASPRCVAQGWEPFPTLALPPSPQAVLLCPRRHQDGPLPSSWPCCGREISSRRTCWKPCPWGVLAVGVPCRSQQDAEGFACPSLCKTRSNQFLCMDAELPGRRLIHPAKKSPLSESSSLWTCPPPPAGGHLGCWGGLGAPGHQAASCTMTQAVGVCPLFSHFVLCPLQADRVLPALAASVFILSPRKPQLQAL